LIPFGQSGASRVSGHRGKPVQNGLLLAFIFGKNRYQEDEMSTPKMLKPAPPPTAAEIAKKIEEAAYYSWLNRGRYAQPGNELDDWFVAERELRDSPKT
jgi:hypothetical protein